MSPTSQFPILDSHIHLFPATHLETLSWHSDNNPLGAQHSIDEYKAAIKANESAVRGFIFLETDRLSSITETQSSESTPTSSPTHGWTHALDEVSLLTRIALGEPITGEGHSPADKDLVWGIIPWAPIPGGEDVLSKYMTQVKERTRTAEVWAKIRGVRYLVQDKPAGTMLQDGFVSSLRWLGRVGLTFDLGVDARSGGLGQLREAVEMMDRVYGVDDGQAVTIIINHMCKPNLRLSSTEVRSHPEFLEWNELVLRMAQAHPKTYMKLSGAFSEIEPLDGESEPDFDAIVERVQPWTDAVFDAFGVERVMFGSDWPVCNIGGGGNDVSWGRWKRVVAEIIERRGLSDVEKQGLWMKVAEDAYGCGSLGVSF
ncbi:Amidohydrolase 2 [Penicillium nucicola]|uniref:Amidohydrolase 2 n=1 Tax=Penicillium nucicola TaxID=1850975 RepID=UPI0025457E3A|nr:Amidohydrolase 2 [Penicillium nucicola]KAJ5747194.1 Amidohydrolase 2 [Penicillium nucicola]